MPTYTTTTLGLRWLQGSNLVSDIDAGFQALAEDADGLFAARDAKLGFSSGGSVRSGKSIIATAETTNSASYTLLTTPDRVQSVVLPTDGLIMVVFQATWKESAAGNAAAAIHLGTTQVQRATGTAVSGQAATTGAPGVTNVDTILHSTPGGLMSRVPSGSGHPGDVTTGQILGSGSGTNAATAATIDSYGGPCWIFASAGTYDVSVRFLSTSGGTITVKNRRLLVRAISY